MRLRQVPAPGHRHPHRTWLHLLPTDAHLVPSPAQLRQTVELLEASGLSLAGPDLLQLPPGPDFARLLQPQPDLTSGPPPVGEVRLEAGVLRCYPDPGPEGFDSEPLGAYHAECPGCGQVLDFYHLHFPFAGPLRTLCPRCGAEFEVPEVGWRPRLPVASAELTFGGVVGRPSLRDSGFLLRLEALWSTPVTEVHVTL
ncbi:MAG: hypothetical protein ACREN7_06605 [Candidatus Dormibacteria bacterium]